ncbi:hypothetical protein Hypma_003020 [Hypsizygus marmoreus]|uniref:Uncharacterized protein n=1 Tax=Hypsizygus marmoreus TaxID=39966 RepID=A0A369J927_HYPMA|nr:hypothetical protein Hypma_003020 [Hypsizygus marmoreus]
MASCDFIAKWTSWPTILSIGTVDVILILRVMAIYGHSKAMTGFLVCTFILSLTAWVTLAFFVLSGTTTLPQSELFTGCLFSAPSYFFAAWIPPVAFESVIIVLTLFRTFRYASVPRALHVLARDSIVYFVIVFLMLIANLFIARFGAGFLGALLIVPCSVVACVAAARMTMNIREFTMSDTVEVTPSAFEMSVIQFRPGDRMSMAQQRQTESSMVYVAV